MLDVDCVVEDELVVFILLAIVVKRSLTIGGEPTCMQTGICCCLGVLGG